MAHADEILQELIERSKSMKEWELTQFQRMLVKLQNFPPSGGGGAHSALLGAANHAVRIGVDEDDYTILMRTVIHGPRDIPDSEISNAYGQALFDYENDTGRSQPGATSRKIWRKAQVSNEQSRELQSERDQLIQDGQGVSVEDIMAASPEIPTADPVWQLRQILQLFLVDEYVYMGQPLGWEVHPARHWKGLARISQKVVHPHIVPNPFTGLPAPKKGGSGTSYRGDQAIAQFRYAVAEFDNLTLADQLAFWSQVDLPIVALIHSGGKSIHAWIRVDDVLSLEDWEQRVGVELYQHYLIPMGVDSACRNPSRLSRTPGHYRADKGQIQQLLYLAPEGRALSL